MFLTLKGRFLRKSYKIEKSHAQWFHLDYPSFFKHTMII